MTMGLSQMVPGSTRTTEISYLGMDVGYLYVHSSILYTTQSDPRSDGDYRIESEWMSKYAYMHTNHYLVRLRVREASTRGVLIKMGCSKNWWNWMVFWLLLGKPLITLAGNHITDLANLWNGLVLMGLLFGTQAIDVWYPLGFCFVSLLFNIFMGDVVQSLGNSMPTVWWHIESLICG